MTNSKKFWNQKYDGAFANLTLHIRVISGSTAGYRRESNPPVDGEGRVNTEAALYSCAVRVEIACAASATWRCLLVVCIHLHSRMIWWGGFQLNLEDLLQTLPLLGSLFWSRCKGSVIYCLRIIIVDGFREGTTSQTNTELRLSHCVDYLDYSPLICIVSTDSVN